MLFSATDALERIEEDYTDATASVVEMMIVSEVANMNDDERKAWCESEEVQALVEANVLRKPTLIRLSKADDERRRTKLAAYALAKAANDPLYEKMKKAYVLKKQLSAKIVQKYGNKAMRVARAAQKDFIKNYGKTQYKSELKGMTK